MPAYLTHLAAFLPNQPVPNQRIESVLGMIGNAPSAVKDLILQRNGIKWRYYAIDPATGEPTHTNTELTAEAVRLLLSESGLQPGAIDLLACGTSSPDQSIPSHAAMVHGALAWLTVLALAVGMCFLSEVSWSQQTSPGTATCDTRFRRIGDSQRFS